MTVEQQHLLTLLDEIDKICEECGVRYTLIETALLWSERRVGIRGSEADIAMTWDDFKLFREKVAKLGIENREFESLENNPDMPGWYYRYVDSSTTLFDLDYAHARISFGIGVNIHISRKSLKNASRKERNLFKSCLTAEHNMHKKVDANLSYGGKILEDPDRSLFERLFDKSSSITLSDFEAFASNRNDSDKVLFLPGSISIEIPKDFFDVERVYLSGHWYYASKSRKWYLEERYGKRWRKATIPYRREGYMAFSSLTVPYARYIARIQPYLDDESLWKRRSDWQLALNTTIKEAEVDQKKWWSVFYMLKDRYRDWKAYAPQKGRLMALYDKGMHGLLGLAMIPYQKHIEQYAKQGFAYVIDDDLWEICLELYRENGHDDYAEKLAVLKGKKPLPPIEGPEIGAYYEQDRTSSKTTINPVFAANECSGDAR